MLCTKTVAIIRAMKTWSNFIECLLHPSQVDHFKHCLKSNFDLFFVCEDIEDKENIEGPCRALWNSHWEFLKGMVNKYRYLDRYFDGGNVICLLLEYSSGKVSREYCINAVDEICRIL